MNEQLPDRWIGRGGLQDVLLQLLGVTVRDFHEEHFVRTPSKQKRGKHRICSAPRRILNLKYP
jgi:hypothetical protein